VTVRSTRPQPPIGRTIAESWRLWRDNVGQLGLIALIAVLPVVAIVEVILHQLDIRPSLIARGALLLVGVAVAALGEALVAGLAEHLLRSGHIGLEPRPLLHHLRSLPVATLTVLVLIVGAVVLIGLSLLVVPGLVAFAWLCLATPAASFERHGVRAALRQSVRLVRGRFWRVVALTGTTFVPTAMVQVLGEVLHAWHVATWLLIVIEASAEAAAISFTAAVVVVIYHHLRGAVQPTGPE
jgi:hypothetical protein